MVRSRSFFWQRQLEGFSMLVYLVLRFRGEGGVYSFLRTKCSVIFLLHIADRARITTKSAARPRDHRRSDQWAPTTNRMSCSSPTPLSRSRRRASSTPRRPRQNRWQPALIGRQPSRWSGQRMGRGDRFRHNSSGGTESSRPNGTRSSKFWPPPKRAGRRRVPVRPRCQSRRLPSSRRPKR